jgi:4-hydroxybenzoate polyprenyltransferase
MNEAGAPATRGAAVADGLRLRDGPRLRDLIELVRAPAALSVPGDVLAGGAAAGWPFGLRTLGLAAASTSLYWAGMALNDYADRVVDAVERPERPIPSGRVLPDEAFRLAVALTGAGLGLAALAGGGRAVAVAIPLAGCIWAYDMRLKSTPAGPAAMAACRGLDVVLGAGAGRIPWAVPPAALVAGHTYVVTTLSRDEVDGGDPATVATTLRATGVVAGVAAAGALRSRAGPTGRAVGLAAAALYAATFGAAQLEARRDPAPRNVRRAVVAGIHGLMPLQAALSAGAGSVGAAAAIGGAFVAARRLGRRVSPT